MEIQPSKPCGVGFAPTVPDLGKPANVVLIQHLGVLVFFTGIMVNCKLVRELICC